MTPRLPIVMYLICLILVTTVAGCGRAPRYDERLVAADSLLNSDPDSALAAVEGVAPGSLATEGDRAYRDLLLTQARYRCYVTATSDSAINHALTYWQAHPGDREKLARAHLYKGVVMEELGCPDSAMCHYKQAEHVADGKGYNTLGQIYVREGSLYRMYYADMQTCYNKYEKALGFYNATGDRHMQLICLYNMGMCLGIIGGDSPTELLDSASRLALELNDSAIYYKSRELVIRQSTMSDTAIDKVKFQALDLFNHYARFLTPDLIFDIAQIYLHEHDTDSSQYFIGVIYPDRVETLNASERIRLYDVMSEIAKHDGDIARCHQFTELSNVLSDSISNNEQKNRIQEIENEKNEENTRKISDKLHVHKAIASILILIALSSLIIIIYQYRKIIIVKSIIKELNNVEVNNIHDEFLEQIHEKETRIELLIRNLVKFIQSTISTTEKDTIAVIRKNMKENIIDLASDEFWIELRNYLDNNYNGVISKIAARPKINDTDIRFIELVCCGFSYIEIAITLGYAPNFVSNKRLRIQKKLGISVPLQDYLNSLLKGDTPS